MRIARKYTVLVLFAILATAAFAAESRAVSAMMKGKVKIKKPGKTAWETLKHFAGRPQGTIVHTEKNSEVTLHLSTGEGLHIGPGQTA